MANADPYDELGIRPDANPDEIRAAFRRAVRQRHPDTSQAADDDSAVRDTIDAYRLLTDPNARARYDAAHTPPAPVVGGTRRVPLRDSTTAPRTSPPTPAPCPACLGAGIVRSKVTCPTCDGRAEITTLATRPARVLRCRTCQGYGQIRTHHTCEQCNGTRQPNRS
jgi:DnaJ-class molecular chaperone